MNANPTVSIIMPVYNEAEYIAFALESVLIQDTDFEYEIIVVDDCSTDETENIVQKYIAAFPDKIIYFKNAENSGNAKTFWQGLTLSRGDYFHVLDGDDFFIRKDKLQRQVDFLRENEEFSAVATNSLRLLEDGRFYPEVHSNQKISEYVYADALAFGFYFHTSSYMYRNVYRDNVPEFLQEEWARGDGIRTLMHAKHGKIKLLNFIGSVYRFNNQGIWSSLSQKQRNERLIWALQQMHDHYATTSFEKDILKKRIHFSQEIYGATKSSKLFKLMMVSPINTLKNAFKLDSWYKLHRYLFPENIVFTPEQKLHDMAEFLNVISYAPKNREKSFAHCHLSPQLDQYCEAIGRVIMDKMKFTWLDREYDENLVVVTVAGLQTQSGGVFREILEFIKIHLDQGHKIKVISHELVRTPKNIFDDFDVFQHVNVEFVAFEGPLNAPLMSKVDWLVQQLMELKPYRLYPFASHTDVVMAAAVQPGLAKEVVLDFCIDHGVSLMTSHSTIDNIIVKLPFHYHMLSKVIYPRNLTYIPFFIQDNKDAVHEHYEPLKNGALTSMTACARSYKLDNYSVSYFKTITDVLKKTNGQHIHIGPLSSEQLEDIQSKLRKAGLKSEQFKHIDWADSLTNLAQQQNVDVYLQSFPIGSGRTTVEMMRAGIPIINHAHQKSLMFHSSDFCSESCPVWSSPQELYEIVAALDETKLRAISKDARQFFEQHNLFEVGQKNILARSGLDAPYRSRYDHIKMYLVEDHFSDRNQSVIYKMKLMLKSFLQTLGLYNTVQTVRKWTRA